MIHKIATLLILTALLLPVFMTTPIYAETPTIFNNFTILGPDNTYMESENYQYPSGQTFTPTANYTATGAAIQVYRNSGLPYDIRIGIWAMNGTEPVEPPTLATALAVGVVSGNYLGTTAPGEWFYVDFYAPVNLVAGTEYALVTNSEGYLGIMGNIFNQFAGGKFFEGQNIGQNWTPWHTSDMVFRIYGADSFTPTAPIIGNSTATNLTTITGKGGATVTGTGGSNVTERGVCVSTTEDPTIDDAKFVGSLTTDRAFTVNMTNLTAGTTYHMRGFATNAQGTSYSDDITFETLSGVIVAPIDSYFAARTVLVFLPGLLLLALIIMVAFIGFGQVRQNDTIAAITIFTLGFLLIGLTLLIAMPIVLSGIEGTIWFE